MFKARYIFAAVVFVIALIISKEPSFSSSSKDLMFFFATIIWVRCISQEQLEDQINDLKKELAKLKEPPKK